jgi:hypothetical protein
MPFDPAHDPRVDALQPRIDLKNEVNFQDQEAVLGDIKAKSFDTLRNERGRKDTQVAVVAEHLARAYLTGFYGKQPRKTYWADGRYITITDDLPPGVDEIAYHTTAGRYTEVDDGIHEESVSPEREIGDALEVTTQKFKTVKHKFSITQQDIWRAAVTGYNKFEQRGAKLREQHMFSINKLIRVGNSKFGLHGIATHPNIKRRAAGANWSTGSATNIYDDVVACISEMYDSPTEDDAPGMLVLPRRAMTRFNTSHPSSATDINLRGWVEEAWRDEGLMVVPDPGMKTASSLGGPAALLYTNQPDLVSVSMPLFMYIMGPFASANGVLEVEIWSRFAGVQVRDTDTIMVVEGDSQNW